MTWIKRQILKALLRLINKIGGRIRVAVARRRRHDSRIYRNGKWGEKQMLKRGLRFRNHFIRK